MLAAVCGACACTSCQLAAAPLTLSSRRSTLWPLRLRYASAERLPSSSKARCWRCSATLCRCSFTAISDSR
eukprot:6328414-Lingulodinium_polyedra.AAC.1